MAFYSNYLIFFKALTQELHAQSSETIALKELVQHLEYPDRCIELYEVDAILKELQYIVSQYGHLLVNKQVDCLGGELGICIGNELQKLCQDMSHASIQPYVSKWRVSNPVLAEYLMDRIGYPRTTAPKEFTEGVQPLSLMQLILLRSAHARSTPPKEWYLARPPLRAYTNHDALLKLGFTDLHAFQQLEFEFPGFLASMVTSFKDLQTFCQLVPNRFQLLVSSPNVQQYIPGPVEYARILEKMYAFDREGRVKLMKAYVEDLDDLVSVTRVYPEYLRLLVDVQLNEDTTSSSTYVFTELPLARHIKTREDILRFDTTCVSMQRIIQNIPRLRALIGTSDVFIQESTQAFEQLKKRRDERFQRYRVGFFLEGTAPNTAPPQKLDDRLLTIGQAICSMQFQDDAGYYSTGTISFSKLEQNGHFATEASVGYQLTVALCCRAFQLWQQLPRKQNEGFDILECGAGDGDLCFKIFEYIQAMALENSEWADFEKNLQYTIIDLSPSLVLRQKGRLADLIQKGRVSVLQGDALKPLPYTKKASLHISNELMDMFPSQQIRLDNNGDCLVDMVIPMLTPESYQYLAQHHPICILGLEEEADAFRSYLNAEGIILDHEGYSITAERFKKILGVIALKEFKGPIESFLFSQYSLPLVLFPEIETYLAKQDDVFTSMRPGDSKIICPELDAYAEMMRNHSLVTIAIDYGSTTFTLKNREYRSYSSCSELYTNIPLMHAGRKDITYDVDFTAALKAINQSEPEAQAYLVHMHQLLPEGFQVPVSLKGYTDVSNTSEYFESPLFFTLIYIAPEAAVSFKDLESNVISLVTQHQLYSYVQGQAKQVVELNLKDEDSLVYSPF